MIYPLPRSWRELQDRVAQILRECGVEAAVEKQIELARGRAVVDVWAHDASSIPPQTYIIECKRWKEAVPQHVVHAFRTIVGDSGANWGAIVSLNGFQSGAHQAANRSNVRLLTWLQFQNLFATAWVERHFWRKVAERCDNLVQYTEPVSSQTMRQSASLSGQLRTEFERLRELHFPLATFCMLARAQTVGALQLVFGRDASPIPRIPLRLARPECTDHSLCALPDAILDATSYSELLTIVLTQVEQATASFDQLFTLQAERSTDVETNAAANV